MKTAQKFFVAFLFSFLLLVFPSFTFAEATSTNSANLNNIININPTNLSQTSPYYANIVIINLIHTLSCFAEGVSIIGQPCITSIQPSNATSTLPTYQAQLTSSGGALGMVGGVLTAMYTTQPLKTTEYLANLGSELGIVSPTYAQVTGSGNAVLSPVFTLWQIFRNIAYLGMILIFIVVGFMIMFRSKINPQTVISVQKALPGLVIGLILITFSYFFAALIVDTTFIATNVAVKLFESTPSNPKNILKEGSADVLLRNGNILTIYDSFLKIDGKALDVAGNTAETLSFLREGIVGNIVTVGSAYVGCNLGKNFVKEGPLGSINSIDIKPFGVGISIDPSKAVGCLTGAGAVAFLANTNITGGLIGLLLYVILIVALVTAMFRVLFALVQSYITIIIQTIFSPLIFLMASIPGREKAVGEWFKSMFANLLAFPAVMFALIFAAYILGGTGKILLTNSTSFNLSGGTIPLLGGLSSSFLQLILGYGVLLMTPAIPEAVRNAFGVKPDQLFGKTAIGGVTAGFGQLKNLYGGVTAPLQQRRAAYRDAYWKARMTGTDLPIVDDPLTTLGQPTGRDGGGMVKVRWPKKPAGGQPASPPAPAANTGGPKPLNHGLRP